LQKKEERLYFLILKRFCNSNSIKYLRKSETLKIYWIDYRSENNFCSNCGSKFELGVKFCSNCGAVIAKEPVAPQVKETKKELTPVTEQVVEEPITQPTAQVDESERNRLIILMVLSIVIPIVGLVLAVIKYTEHKKKAALHYLLCGLSGIAFGMGFWNWAGFIIGVMLILSTIYNGLNLIKSGDLEKVEETEKTEQDEKEEKE
jgi:hypothetical protein